MTETFDGKEGLPFAPSEQNTTGKPPLILRSEDIEDQLFGQAIERFEESFAKEKGAENDYNYQYMIGIKRSENQTDEPDYDTIDPEILETMKSKKLKAAFNNSEQGGTIQVFITRKSGKSSGASSRNTPVSMFLSKIPYVKNYPSTKAITDMLTTS